MFEKIRRRLLLSYLIVLSLILGGFAVAVRIVFTHSLHKQQTEKLAALAQVAAANAEFDNGRIKIENDLPQDKLFENHQGLNWFDTKGNLIEKQGQDILSLPVHVIEGEQINTVGKNRVQSVTLPIISSDDKQFIGYVRASQSLEEFDETLNKLDLGLGGGIVVALIISSVGGVWLTRQAMQPIEESFERLKQFTADASHELRSPLMAIKSNAGVALKYPEGIRETDAEKFQAISSATNQMTRLTEDLLFLARQDNLPSRSKETVNLSSVLNNLVQLYQPQAIAKQINLKNQLTEKLYLLGDTNQITRLFTNLIQNAIHYTPSEGIVEITANRSASDIVVNVQDTGVGIAPKDLGNIFERFWRADKSRSYNSGGSGLGLAIAQAIAQNHGGLINVTSQLGIGSCFTVRLPASSLN
ncbi:two-component sensor histidine kinase [Anabaena cylindrica FACHB-243]|uniref:histidine kinase n=1 Tax=Anabaena cylindrica (strain ATCC 27899 / PCC 7122) TaxID=272123 RepID=K9ZPF5_ANACC|nr:MULTISPECIES: ATP-binding protein [Anabaena]AFZ61118.1 histidine kinase [Anabaena cylindrica PCC 7122]MBD2421592.1 two-component sensor histidine kinase [Anabaena cylindrica FACHB-243]MBY5280509.1 two-component sensor histidine kinase [Anabaena sp. CCAP 1446/1C]MBY5308098.1 two-component sensor histidine kinase [Anabaena sp. CCAP 1446/1C]MCM2405507.1 HAMP domain-containing histidine kinase [Anabaena sp. CCAP 1446/1C]